MSREQTWLCEATLRDGSVRTRVDRELGASSLRLARIKFDAYLSDLPGEPEVYRVELFKRDY